MRRPKERQRLSCANLRNPRQAEGEHHRKTHPTRSKSLHDFLVLIAYDPAFTPSAPPPGRCAKLVGHRYGMGAEQIIGMQAEFCPTIADSGRHRPTLVESGRHWPQSCRSRSRRGQHRLKVLGKVGRLRPVDAPNSTNCGPVSPNIDRLWAEIDYQLEGGARVALCSPSLLYLANRTHRHQQVREQDAPPAARSARATVRRSGSRRRWVESGQKL